MFCRNCGKEIQDTATFCPECGSPVVKNDNMSGMEGVNNKNNYSPYGNAGNTNYSPKKNNNAAVIAIVVAVIVVVAVVAAVVVFGLLPYTSKSSKVEEHEETITKEIKETENETTTSNDIVVVTKRDGYGNHDYGEDSQVQNPVVGDDNVNADDSDDSEYIIPDSDTRKITNKDLKGLSKEELRIARNEIYARKGRRFDDEELQNYFDSRSWYVGTTDPEDFSEDELTDTEKANRNTIIKYEEKKGYK